MELARFPAVSAPITSFEFIEILGLTKSEYDQKRKRNEISMTCQHDIRKCMKFRYHNTIDLFEYLLVELALPEMISKEKRRDLAELAIDAVLMILEERPDNDLVICEVQIVRAMDFQEIQSILDLSGFSTVTRAGFVQHVCEQIAVSWGFATDSAFNVLDRSE